MSEYFVAYIHRGDFEVEVSAKLHEHGEPVEGSDSDTGPWREVRYDPVFTDFVAFDDYGVELTLTPRELLDSEKQMTKQYWDNYENGGL